jgi:hypothetical protein
MGSRSFGSNNEQVLDDVGQNQFTNNIAGYMPYSEGLRASGANLAVKLGGMYVHLDTPRA